jgi:hypothetical protein
MVGEEARSSQLAKLGIRTTQDFANVMSSLMADVLSGSVSAGRANAACNAGRQMLRAVELQLKYGTQNDATTNERTLRISTLAEGK